MRFNYISPEAITIFLATEQNCLTGSPTSGENLTGQTITDDDFWGDE